MPPATYSLAEFDERLAIDTLKPLGFHRVALLPNYLIDSAGKTHAMTVLMLKLT